MAQYTLEDGTKIEAFTQDELQAKIEAETSGLKAKVDELLGEKKTVSQRAKELEESASVAEQERLKEKEQFKTLWEREQASKKELQEKYEDFATRIQKRETEVSASEIAMSLTRDTKRAELLKEQVSKFAKYSEDGIKFEMGGVEVPREKIVSHLTENYAFLVDGSQATGGGAEGSKGGGAAGKTLKRSDFESMAHTERAKFFETGGKLVDE